MIDWRGIMARLRLRLTHPATAYRQGVEETVVASAQEPHLMKAAAIADEKNPYK